MFVSSYRDAGGKTKSALRGDAQACAEQTLCLLMGTMHTLAGPGRETAQHLPAKCATPQDWHLTTCTTRTGNIPAQSLVTCKIASPQ